MKYYLLIITLLGVCTLSYTQKGLTLEEVKEILSSMEEEGSPLIKDPFSTFGLSSTEEVQLTVAERNDTWSTQQWSSRDSVKFFYDELGRETATETLEYIFGEWNTTSRSTNTFNDQGRIDTILYEVNMQEEWQLDEREIFIYNDENTLTEDKTEVWNGEEWQPTRRTLRVYDDEGNLIESANENWVSSTESWTPSFKSEYEYESETGLVTSFFIFIWDFSSGQFSNILWWEYSYDEQGRDSSVLRYDGDEEEWLLDERLTYEYDSPASNIVNVVTIESYADGEWELNNRFRYTYNGNITTSYREVWDPEVEEWTPVNLTINEQDDEERLIFRLSRTWIDSTSSYQDEESIEWVYNDNNRVRIIKERNTNTGELINTLRNTLFYTTIVSTEEQLTAVYPLLLYPNPNPGTFTVNLSNTSLQQSASLQLRCTDLQGRTVMHTDVDSGAGTLEVTLPNVPTGTYLLYLTDGQQLWQQKVIIQR